MIALPAAGVALLAAIFDGEWGWLLWFFIVFIGGAMIFVIGASLKRHAYKLAERDGIKASDY
ncbi:MAG: hypothetical protein A2Z34_05295 [Planctomycetes bacterium RBG_16_59_8]|nr:MAG: hypothetical protein A2Z34_05295 [Planctomycetes bacterium RBG_16_59_8]